MDDGWQFFFVGAVNVWRFSLDTLNSSSLDLEININQPTPCWSQPHFSRFGLGIPKQESQPSDYYLSQRIHNFGL